MYKVTNYTKQQAKKLNVKITPSEKKNKKLDVFTTSGKYITSVGDNRYKDYPTYINEKGQKYADDRRKLYKARHEKDRKVRNSAGYYADKLLW